MVISSEADTLPLTFSFRAAVLQICLRAFAASRSCFHFRVGLSGLPALSNAEFQTVDSPVQALALAASTTCFVLLESALSGEGRLDRTLRVPCFRAAGMR